MTVILFGHLAAGAVAEVTKPTTYQTVPLHTIFTHVPPPGVVMVSLELLLPSE